MNATGVIVGLGVAVALVVMTGRWASSGRIAAIARDAVSTDRRAGGPEDERAGADGARGRGRARDGTGLVIDVATAVRAGISPDRAWTAAGVACGPSGVPALVDVIGAGISPGDAHAVVSGCRLAHQLGAPLAPVLEGIGVLLDEQAELAGDRAATAAGPRSSIRVMTWLPLACLGVGAAMGADPVHVLLTGGPGRVAFATGALLLWTGHRWARALVRSAERAGRA